jgi:endoglucanase
MALLAMGVGPVSAQPRSGRPSSGDCLADRGDATGRVARGGLDAVPSDRRAVLARGVNVTNLFWSKENWSVEDTFRRLRSFGVRHVRIPVSPELFSEPPPTWKAAALARLDTAVCTAVALDLGIVIDLHPSQALGPPGSSNDMIAAHLADVWKQLAGRYAKASPERVFFEILNEPKLPGKEWEVMQEHLLQVIRASAPRNTVILTASPWSTADALSALSPSADRNVVYTFHLYTPMIFTHQSAEWVTTPPNYGSIRGLSYPARPDNVAVVERTATPSLRPALMEYAKEFTNGAAIAAEVGIAGDWSRRHNATVIATEFGVYDRTASRTSRAAWLQDVRQAFERNQIGWTVWEYVGGFGVGDDLQRGCLATDSIATALALCGR